MSIKITPTTASGLTHADYTVLIGGELDPHQERAKKTSNTLSGVPVSTLWKKTKVGASMPIEATVSNGNYEIIKNICYHETIFTWLVISKGARFVCEVDLLSAARTVVFGSPDYKTLQLNFLIIEVL